MKHANRSRGQPRSNLASFAVKNSSPRAPGNENENVKRLVSLRDFQLSSFHPRLSYQLRPILSWTFAWIGSPVSPAAAELRDLMNSNSVPWEPTGSVDSRRVSHARRAFCIRQRVESRSPGPHHIHWTSSFCESPSPLLSRSKRSRERSSRVCYVFQPLFPLCAPLWTGRAHN